MTWQSEFVSILGNFVKLVFFYTTHGGEFPSYSLVTKPVFEERNRLIVQGNERLKRIEELEADVKNLRMCNDDLRGMINEGLDDLDKQIAHDIQVINDKDDQIIAMKEFIESLISG